MRELSIVIRNFTPHRQLHLVSPALDLVQQGEARCAEVTTIEGSWDEDGILPRVSVSYGAVTGLPDPQPGTILLVSQLVVRALSERRDLAYPFGLVRDADGTITGFTTLAHV